MSIRVLIADDHKIMLAGLRSLLEKQADIEVVGEADNGRKAVQIALAKKPNVVVMDVSMPDLNGIEATTQICESLPKTWPETEPGPAHPGNHGISRRRRPRSP